MFPPVDCRGEETQRRELAVTLLSGCSPSGSSVPSSSLLGLWWDSQACWGWVDGGHVKENSMPSGTLLEPRRLRRRVSFSSRVCLSSRSIRQLLGHGEGHDFGGLAQQTTSADLRGGRALWHQARHPCSKQEQLCSGKGLSNPLSMCISSPFAAIHRPWVGVRTLGLTPAPQKPCCEALDSFSLLSSWPQFPPLYVDDSVRLNDARVLSGSPSWPPSVEALAVPASVSPPLGLGSGLGMGC